MSTQPDLILKYAHYLSKIYAARGVEEPQVFAEVYVALNGKMSALFVDSTVDLLTEKPGWLHYKWVLPYNQKSERE
jgi:hypothetical protein